MEWSEIKDNIRADLLARGLKEPRLRLSALDRLENLLAECYPNFLNNPKVLLNVGKDAVSKELARVKETGVLNGAEKSVLNDIFTRLKEASLHISTARRSREPHSQATASNRKPTGHATREGIDIKIGLPPVIWERSRILILGTLPGDDSLRLQEYYAHGNNQFWKILPVVYGETVGVGYSQRLEFLQGKGVALWDVLRSAKRAGSSDSSIEAEVANDFVDLLKIYTNLKAIVFNGRGAQKLFRRHAEKSLATVSRPSLPTFYFPSTSPTPGRYVLPLEKKVVRWKSLLTL
ncbi:MAG: DNA-deoxyinosine glycosylase [Candidatus Marinimicrobia bacterium]|nr:DNA-deoxyinosine glycosylase [Candidatus Neomarinimicrobiota bacterium]